MDRINLAKPDFWALRPGLNVVTFEADVNVSAAGPSSTGASARAGSSR